MNGECLNRTHEWWMLGWVMGEVNVWVGYGSGGCLGGLWEWGMFRWAVGVVDVWVG